MTIRLLLSDVDGTLVRSDKSLSERTIEAVRLLHAEGIRLALTSGRPPRGMEMLVEPLRLTSPLAAFNGGLVVEPVAPYDVLEERIVPARVVAPVIALLESFELDVWLYRGNEWLVRNVDAPHVAQESRAVQFSPTAVASFDGHEHGVVKILGVSDDPQAVSRAAQAAHAQFGEHVSAARSHTYYLDVTHPDANKGAVVGFLSRRYGIPADEIATIGDMPNDVLMFVRSGLSIAMGNADADVRRAARQVTTTNDEDGFAHAVERFVLGQGG